MSTANQTEWTYFSIVAWRIYSFKFNAIVLKIFMIQIMGKKFAKL